MSEGGHLPEKPNELFDWLAGLLLARYATGSGSQTKVSVILGAGSSVWSGLSVWDRAFKLELIEESSKLFRERRTFVDECWRELNATVGLPVRSGEYERRDELVERASIEDVASVALKYSVVGDGVYQLLRRRFTPDGAGEPNHFQPPQLAYELIAHFLKHGFIDHLLTFNFDELLDEAVANELGPGEYAYIATEQDTSTRPPDSLPHLIKLHGTLSRPETLRFTRNATASLPPSMTRLLDRVVLDIDPRTERRLPDARDAYLVSMGYGWRDTDIVHWLEARRDYVKGLLILSRNAHDDVQRLHGLFGESKGWRREQVRVLDIDALCSVPPDTVTVDLVLSALWTALESAMTQSNIQFMPASRHILLGYLFGPRAREVGARLNQHTPLRRFVTEFVLHLAKCKGMVNISTMAGSDRISRYYGPVRDAHSERALACGCDLLGLVTAPGFIDNLQYQTPPEIPVTRTVEQSRYPDVKETYYAVADAPQALATPLLNSNGFTTGPVDRPIFDRARGRIVYRPDTDGRRFVEEHIEKIFEGPEIEVGRRTSLRASWSLRSAVPIPTFIDLQLKTQQVLEASWSDLLVIAESGAWLTSPPIKDRVVCAPARHVLLIEADQPPSREWPLRSRISFDLSSFWDDYRQHDVRVVCSALSWWQHNRHMTLAFAERGGVAACLGGIYFRRRHKASRIQPMWVAPGDAEDVAELVLTFLSYLRRSLDELRRLVSPGSVAPSDGPPATSSGRKTDAAAVAEALALRDRACAIAEGLEHPASVRPRIEVVIQELRRFGLTELGGA